MFNKIVPGLIGEAEMVVSETNTAKHLGSGNISVLATPEIIRLMEKASVAAVDHLLPEGYLTVGNHLDVRHVAPTPVGMTVRARSILESVDENKLTFHVEAWDEHEMVGTGTHRRVIVNRQKFDDRIGKKCKA